MNFELYFGDNFSSFQKLALNKKKTPKVFFVDAPFHLNLEQSWMDFFQKEKDYLLVIERNKDLSKLFTQQNIALICLKKYGRIYLHFLQVKGNQK